MVDVTSKNILKDAIIKNISDSIHNLHNGIVNIVVQNSRIIPIEVTKRNTYDEIWNMEGGAGI